MQLEALRPFIMGGAGQNAVRCGGEGGGAGGAAVGVASSDGGGGRTDPRQHLLEYGGEHKTRKAA